MATSAKIDVRAQDLSAAFRDFVGEVLQQGDIRAVLVPQRLPMKDAVMPVLISDPDCLEGIDPFSPAFALNSAKVVAKLTRKPMGATIAAVMRPCEIRALVELVKLKQARIDELLIIGLDCPGAYRNTDFARLAEGDAQPSGPDFVRKALSGQGAGPPDIELATACKVCEKPVPTGADIAIGLWGMNTDKELLVLGQTERGAQLISRLDLASAEVPEGRAGVIADIQAQRTARRDDMFAETRSATNDIEKLTAYLAACVNCYNCRVACPVCYCKECVFVTDVFNHEPSQYLQWAMRKGAVKMPTDTVFYHLTRLAHMSTACVGCGQCSNACPNEIPVMELFRTVAHRTQLAFDYEAGRSIDEHPPLSEFREDEFKEVVGIAAN